MLTTNRANLSLLAAVVAVCALAPATGCRRDVERAQPATMPSVEQVEDSPSRYYGRTVTLTGEVDEIYTNRAFTLEGNGLLWDEEIPVITRSGVSFSGRNLADDDKVTVTGVVRPFVVADIERELGWDLAPELEVQLKDKVAVVANSISRIDEFARWSEDDPEGAIVSYTAVITTIDPDSLVGQKVTLQGIPMRSKMGKGVWLGHSHRSQTLVVPADDAAAEQVAAQMSEGTPVDVTGTLRKMPQAREAMQQWNLPANMQRQIQEEVLYIEANRITKAEANSMAQEEGAPGQAAGE